jgi:L-threonylcarbamoyladenylate synthase
MQDVQAAAAALQRGALVGMPTETVYGLAGDARNPAAVAAIFAAKRRPGFDPLIVHVADLEQAEGVAHFDERARLLARRCWPGPLTLVLPRRPGIPDLVTSGLETVGVRCPDHPLALALIRASGLALAAPSANLFGRISPTTAAHVSEQLGEAVAMILDGGPCRVGVESTVLALAPQATILRPGGYGAEELSALLGEPVLLADTHRRAEHLPAAAPGLLASHYAPGTPLRLRARGEAWPRDPGIGLLAFRGHDLPAGASARVLSPSGDCAEAATRLFAALRELDGLGLAAIVAETLPEQGLGVAINDRLRRAAGLG